GEPPGNIPAGGRTGEGRLKPPPRNGSAPPAPGPGIAGAHRLLGRGGSRGSALGPGEERPPVMDLRDIPLGQYVPGNSLLHRTDPRIKLVGGMVFSVAIFGVGAGWGYGLLALYVAVLAGVARIPLSFLVKGLRPLFLLMVVAAGLHLFFTPGEVWALLGPLTVTREGLVTSGHMLMRLILLL